MVETVPPEAHNLRAAILAALRETGSLDIPFSPAALYVPLSHLKALHLDASVITGCPGTGKSFYASLLQSGDWRGLPEDPGSGLSGIEVRTGFANDGLSTAGQIGNHPDAPDIARLTDFLDNGGDPYDLWRAVIVKWVAGRFMPEIAHGGWNETVAWLKSRPEAAESLMRRSRDWRGLIVFDAPDHTVHIGSRMDAIVHGLLRATAWLKSFPGLYAKVFLREDQARQSVFNFPGAARLMATKAELTWQCHDLHGLLWQRLINAPGIWGELMRSICPHRKQAGIWQVSGEMKRESEAQRNAFERLAGPWVGTSRYRATPYTWCVSHLADGHGQLTPRSFLAAIRQAAEDSARHHGTHGFALHHAAIRRSLRQASEIRIREVARNYPWVTQVLSELKGILVPCAWETVARCWETRFPDGPESIFPAWLPSWEGRLEHRWQRWDRVRKDLCDLGLLETRQDGYIDMPDLYRVGFGLGRTGGLRRSGHAVRDHDHLPERHDPVLSVTSVRRLHPGHGGCSFS